MKTNLEELKQEFPSREGYLTDTVKRYLEIYKDRPFERKEIFLEKIKKYLVLVKEKEKIGLDEVHKVYQDSLYIEDLDRIDVVLAVALSRKLEGIPIWLILVGPSGDMKSAQLNAIEGEDVYILHNLTSKTLVNGYKDKKEHPDLAPELNKKLVLIYDMAQILKLPPIEKGELWGQLRDLYDGYAGKISGLGSRAKYKDLHISLVAGSTPAIDSQILVHQDLGTRELIYRTSGNVNKEKVMDKCFENEEIEEKIKKDLRDITTKFLDSIDIKRIDISEEILDKIKSISLFISYMRAVSEFDQYSNELRNDVYPEEPTRISKQLKRLYICLKSLSDSYSDENALRILGHIAKSSCFPIRIKIFEFLSLKGDEEFSTSQLADFLRVGKSTIKRECLTMENIGLVKCRRQETSYPDRFYEYWKINKGSKLINLLIPSKDIIYNNVKYSIYNYTISMDGLGSDIKEKQKKERILTDFTEEEIKKAGYTKEEVNNLMEEAVK